MGYKNKDFFTSLFLAELGNPILITPVKRLPIQACQAFGMVKTLKHMTQVSST